MGPDLGSVKTGYAPTHSFETSPKPETTWRPAVNSLLEILAAGGIAVWLLISLPHIKEIIRKSQAVENPDWAGALIPLGLVTLFVILLIVLS